MKKLYPFLLLVSAATFAQVGTVDNSFNPADNGTYRQYNGGRFYYFDDNIPIGYSIAVRQPDGKLLIDFQEGENSGIQRLNADGSVDTSFTPVVMPLTDITGLWLQPDNKFIVVSGSWVLKRYNSNGTLDNTFAPPTFSTWYGNTSHYAVNDMKFQNDGKIYILGNFSTADNLPKKGIVRLNGNGTIDSTFNVGTGFDWPPADLEILPNGQLLVGGSFTNYNSHVNRKYFIRLNNDGTLDTTLNFSSSSYFYFHVYGLELLPNGKIMVYGTEDFYRHNNAFRKSVIRLNSNYTLDTTFNANNIFSPNIEPDIAQIKVQPDEKTLVIISNNSGYKISRLNTDGTLDTSFTHDNVRVLGNLGKIILQPDGKVIIPMSYLSASGISRNNIYRINSNGSFDSSFNPFTGANHTVSKIGLLNDNKMIIAGKFTSYNDIPAKHWAKLNADGTVDTSFQLDPLLTSTPVDASESYFGCIIKEQNDGKLVIASNNIKVGENFNNLLRLNNNGSFDVGFNFTGYGLINSFDLRSDGKIIVAGSSDYFKVNNKYKLVRLNTDGSVDTSYPVYAFNTFPLYVEVQNTGKVLVAGDFFNYNNQNAAYLIRLNEDGTIDTSFNFTLAGATAVYKTITLPDGKIIISYKHTEGFSNQYRIARLNANGSVDNTFIINAGAYISFMPNGFTDVTVLEDGRILLKNLYHSPNNMENFNTVNTNNRAALLLNADGTWDQSFMINRPEGGLGEFYDVAVQGCDKLLLAGRFTKYTDNTNLKNHILRINLTNNPAMPAGNTTQTFTPGETLANLDVIGQNVQWYSMQSECSVLSTSRSDMDTDTPLPLNTPLQNGVTYYASQTVNGLESSSRLGVTAMAAMGVNENTIDAVKLYPNPTTGMFTISGDADITSVTVYTLYGQTLFTKPVNANEAQIDLSPFQTGMYLIKVTSGNGEKTYKVNKL